MNNLTTSFSAFNAKKIYEQAENPAEFDETILDKIVDIVGSEEEVEQCAKEAYEELQMAFNKGEKEFGEEDAKSASNLAVSALIVKLVEKGSIGPQEADDLLEDLI
jgi:hypothetical protein